MSSESMKEHLPTRICMDDVRSCLERSGYLLESKVVRLLDSAGYFVEPNQVVRDRSTGKSREIDFVAEYYAYNPATKKTVVNTNFIGEIVNSLYPFVLLTERPNSPNADTDNYVKWITSPSDMFFDKEIDFYEGRNPSFDRLYSQYCVLTKKSGQAKEWMAHHPDDIYHSLLKMAEFIETEMIELGKRIGGLDDEYHRAYFWHSFLVLGGDLLVARPMDDGSISVEPAASGFLEFNWHYGEERRTTVIEVVRVEHLVERMNKLVDLDASLKKKISDAYSKARDIP